LTDSIQAALEICPDGVSRSGLSNLLGRNKPAAELDRAINLLIERGGIGFEREETVGRPAMRYWL
jgi:hypothetical protein